MNNTPREALEEAIQAVVADGDPGVYVTGYALVATGVLPDNPGFTAYRYVIPTDQPVHVTRGLVSMLDDAACDFDGMTIGQLGEEDGE